MNRLRRAFGIRKLLVIDAAEHVPNTTHFRITRWHNEWLWLGRTVWRSR
jgi:hypothetical protein